MAHRFKMNSGQLQCMNLAYYSCYLQNKCDFQTGDWGEPSITLRPPNEATASTPVQYWQHHPEKLIFQSCDYKAFVSSPELSTWVPAGIEGTFLACLLLYSNIPRHPSLKFLKCFPLLFFFLKKLSSKATWKFQTNGNL